MLGTHEDEERGALGREDLLQTAEHGQGQGAGVMDLRFCTQDGVAAGQQGLPQQACQPGLSRRPPGAGSIELRREGLEGILPQQASGS